MTCSTKANVSGKKAGASVSTATATVPVHVAPSAPAVGGIGNALNAMATPAGQDARLGTLPAYNE